jgi:acetyl-CoA carboxylase biotin carboxyl carrier protein
MTDNFVMELVEKFNESEVVALDFARGNTTINLKKAAGCVSGVSNSVSHISTNEIVHNQSVQTQHKATENEVIKKTNEGKHSENKNTKNTDNIEIIKSPIVGTFYRAPSPDAPPFAEAGKIIKKGEGLCILEAMKMMNTLECEFDLEVVKVLAENGELVEFDQPLFEVKKI